MSGDRAVYTYVVHVKCLGGELENNCRSRISNKRVTIHVTRHAKMNFSRVLQRSSRQFCFSCQSRTHATNANAPDTGARNSSEKHKKTTAPAAAVSSCPADTVLEGINYMKGQMPMLARSDDQYPDWLWTILQPKVWPDDGPGGKAERVQRRMANRQSIKDRNFMQTQ